MPRISVAAAHRDVAAVHLQPVAVADAFASMWLSAARTSLSRYRSARNSTNELLFDPAKTLTWTDDKMASVAIRRQAVRGRVLGNRGLGGLRHGSRTHRSHRGAMMLRSSHSFGPRRAAVARCIWPKNAHEALEVTRVAPPDLRLIRISQGVCLMNRSYCSSE